LFSENVDAEEAKSIFESNFSHIYYILYDTFVTAEANLRQRGTVNYLPYTVYYYVVGLVFTFSNKQIIHTLTKQRLHVILHYDLKIQMELLTIFLCLIALLIIAGDKQWNGSTPI
jgi:hypothetical protein